MVNMKFHIVFEKQVDNGYSVYVLELPGCISQGDTLEEAKANIEEAIELYLEEQNKQEVESLYSNFTVLEQELVI